MKLFTKRPIALAIVLCSITATFIAPASAQAAKQSEHRLKIDGLNRAFITHVPNSAKQGAALVVLLHGGTSSMHKTLKWPAGQDWKRLSNQYGFVLIAPNGTQSGGRKPAGNKQHWNDHRAPKSKGVERIDDVKFILKVIDWAAQTYKINRNKVYVTGASNGGMMTYRMVLEAPEAFAGGAAFIANLPAATPKLKQSGRPVPLFIANATDDPLTGWKGGNKGARGFKDHVLSVPQTRDFWLANNRAQTSPRKQRVMADQTPEDGCKLKIADHAALSNGARVRLVTLQGSGHTVPSRSGRMPQTRIEKRLLGNRCFDASGAAMAWAFLTGRSDPK